MASTMPQTEPWEWKYESPINCLYVCTHGKGMKRWPTERDDPQGKESKRNERNPTWMYCTYRRSIDGHAHATPPSLIFATSYSCDGQLSRNPKPHLRTHSPKDPSYLVRKTAEKTTSLVRMRTHDHPSLRDPFAACMYTPFPTHTAHVQLHVQVQMRLPVNDDLTVARPTRRD
jgi:hypothetical protein